MTPSFTNMEPLRHSPTIEIVSAGQVWDLHNAADYIAYSHDSEHGRLRLSWDYGCDHPGIAGGEVGLEFFGVSSLRITDPDPDVPRSEDSCLESITLCQDDSLRVEFRGGVVFTFRCQEVRFVPGTTSGHLV